MSLLIFGIALVFLYFPHDYSVKLTPDAEREYMYFTSINQQF